VSTDLCISETRLTAVAVSVKTVGFWASPKVNIDLLNSVTTAGEQEPLNLAEPILFAPSNCGRDRTCESACELKCETADNTVTPTETETARDPETASQTETHCETETSNETETADRTEVVRCTGTVSFAETSSYVETGSKFETGDTTETENLVETVSKAEPVCVSVSRTAHVILYEPVRDARSVVVTAVRVGPSLESAVCAVSSVTCVSSLVTSDPKVPVGVSELHDCVTEVQLQPVCVKVCQCKSESACVCASASVYVCASACVCESALVNCLEPELVVINSADDSRALIELPVCERVYKRTMCESVPVRVCTCASVPGYESCCLSVGECLHVCESVLVSDAESRFVLPNPADVSGAAIVLQFVESLRVRAAGIGCVVTGCADLLVAGDAACLHVNDSDCGYVSCDKLSCCELSPLGSVAVAPADKGDLLERASVVCVELECTTEMDDCVLVVDKPSVSVHCLGLNDLSVGCVVPSTAAVSSVCGLSDATAECSVHGVTEASVSVYSSCDAERDLRTQSSVDGVRLNLSSNSIVSCSSPRSWAQPGEGFFVFFCCVC